MADSQEVFSEGSAAFMMLSTALVLFMTPGVAFFYGGLVNNESVATIMIQCFVVMGVISFWWWLVGFSLCFGQSAGIIGNPATYVGLMGVSPSQNLLMNGILIEKIPGLVYCMFQLAFAIVTPVLMTGGFEKRLRFKPYVIFILLWATFVYAPFAHLSWGGGLFYQWGVRDFAGGTVVHMTSGWSALASVLVLGRREYPDDEPSSTPFLLLGTAILWFGWFGFNGGSALTSSPVAVTACMNSQLAAGTGLWVWMAQDILHKRKPSLVGACFGAVAGLVVITPAAGYVQPWSSVVMGVVVSIVARTACILRKRFMAHWFDDALDVWGTHGVGGLVGAILVGALADPAECAPIDGGVAPTWCVNPNSVTRSWDQLRKQIVAAVLCAVYCMAATVVLLKLLGCFVMLRSEDYESGWIDEEPHTPSKIQRSESAC